MQNVKSTLVAAMLLCAGLLSFAASVSARTLAKTERGALTHNIVMKWADTVQNRPRGDIRRWAEQMTPLFQKVPLNHLRNAAMATTFEQMNDALLGKPVSSRMATPKYLGEITRDYVFTPVVPCRIVDTRFNSPIYGGQVRSFMGTDSSFANAGGSASNCGLPNRPEVLVLNVTVVDPMSAGYLTVYPTSQQRPTASSLNYGVGQIVGNQTMVQTMSYGSYVSFDVYSLATTHVVVDVLGYFDEVQLTHAKLDCVVANATTSIDGQALAGVNYVECPAGYALTSVNCLSGSDTFANTDLQVVSTIIYSNVERAACYVRNNAPLSKNLVSQGRCCRQRSP